MSGDTLVRNGAVVLSSLILVVGLNVVVESQSPERDGVQTLTDLAAQVKPDPKPDSLPPEDPREAIVRLWHHVDRLDREVSVLRRRAKHDRQRRERLAIQEGRQRRDDRNSDDDSNGSTIFGKVPDKETQRQLRMQYQAENSEQIRQRVRRYNRRMERNSREFRKDIRARQQAEQLGDIEQELRRLRQHKEMEGW